MHCFLLLSLWFIQVYGFHIKYYRSTKLRIYSSSIDDANKKTKLLDQNGRINIAGDIQQVSPNELLPLLPTSKAPSSSDLQVIEERHLDHKVTGVYGVEAGLCKYNIPRAFIQYPCGGRISSGMIRLSCPHLVKEIDLFEKDGGIEYMNSILNQDESLQNNFIDINKKHAEIRYAATTNEERELMNTKLGLDGASNLLKSGIIGVTPTKVDDIKCIHAQVADFLLRGNNEIGRKSLEYLEKERGVDIRGCNTCSQQCNLSIKPNKESQHWYMPAKNKQRLRASKERRKQHKAAVAAKREREREERRQLKKEAWLAAGGIEN